MWWDSLSPIERLQIKLKGFYNTKIRSQRQLRWRIEGLEDYVKYLMERDGERNHPGDGKEDETLP